MGVGEVAPLVGERIHVGCADIRMAAEKPGPVIEIIDTDHQDVRARH